MENRCSSSQPSGVRLLALLQGQWKEILRREESNAFLMHLYGTGTHWVAFRTFGLPVVPPLYRGKNSPDAAFRLPLSGSDGHVQPSTIGTFYP